MAFTSPCGTDGEWLCEPCCETLAEAGGWTFALLLALAVALSLWGIVIGEGWL